MINIDHFIGNSSRLETLIIHGITPKDCIIGTLMVNRWKYPLRRPELHRSAAQCKTHSIRSLASVAFINYVGVFLHRSNKTARHGDEILSLQKSWAWFLEDLLSLGVYRALTSLQTTNW